MKRRYLILVIIYCFSNLLYAGERINIHHEIKNDGTIEIKDLNFRLKIPKGWYIAEGHDWHSIASLISKKQGLTLRDSAISVSFTPKLGKTLDTILWDMLNNLAIQFKKETATPVGPRREVLVAGIYGFYETYSYMVDNVHAAVTITMFEKGDFAYGICLYCQWKNDGAPADSYKEVLSSISFIDPSRDIPPRIAEKLIQEQLLIENSNKRGMEI